jgi:hypothetical protein
MLQKTIKVLHGSPFLNAAHPETLCYGNDCVETLQDIFRVIHNCTLHTAKPAPKKKTFQDTAQ